MRQMKTRGRRFYLWKTFPTYESAYRAAQHYRYKKGEYYQIDRTRAGEYELWLTKRMCF